MENKGYNKLTIAIIVAIVALITVVDVFLAYKFGEPGTISVNLWKASHDWPVIPFLIGVLCGHLFFRIRNEK